MADAATHRQIAVVLEELSHDIETLGTMLCSDMDLAMRHVAALQAFDMIAQKQRSLAILLDAESPEAHVEQIAIDTLRDRMRQSP
ncbi:hypothetical protein [Novosphingobium sp.]|uniref:hypothetical protein n=1 Tax=Novosphingobium sp. TaxID=1874826 RepID=UPI003B529DAE